jgi:hypothetical protein
MRSWGLNGSTSRCSWAKEAGPHYLGLKFRVQGRTHYGWARVKVALSTHYRATLTGYAYETVANKPIITGKTKGPDVITIQPGSLGHLAAGASAIPAWRSGK